METKKIPNSQVKSLSCVQLFATPWTAAHQAPLSMGFSNPEKEHWSWCNQVPWLQTILQNYSHQNSNSSVQLGHSVVSWLFVTSWTAAHQTSLSITNSWSLLKPMSIESVMPFNHLIFCHTLLLPPLIFPSIRVFSNESALCIQILCAKVLEFQLQHQSLQWIFGADFL